MKELIKTDSLGDDDEVINSKIDKLSMKKSESIVEEENKEENTKKIKTLLLQYRHGSAGVQHFIHIKHMIELAYFQKEEDEEQHQVIFVIHLRRDTPSESFPLVLSRRWHQIFIDSLQQRKPILLESISTQSIGDIFKLEGINILSLIFRRSLSHLQFSTSVEPQIEIERLLSIFSINPNNNLQNCILKRMLSLLCIDKLNIPIARLVVDNVRNIHDNGQWMRGSFYERFSDIVQKIVMVTLTNVLRSIYINNNIYTFHKNKNKNKNDNLNDLFIKLFSNKDLVEISAITSTISLILQNKPILVDVPHEYNAKFPFSYSINQWCYAQKSFLRSFREDENNNNDDEKEDEKEGHVNNIENKSTEMDIKLQRTKQISDYLKQFMRGSHDPLPLLTQLPHNLSQLYANDLIWLHSTQLPINKHNTSQLFIKLSSKCLMTITAAICGLPPKQNNNISQPENENENNEIEGGIGNIENLQHQDSIGDDDDDNIVTYMSKDAIQQRDEKDEKEEEEESFISIPELQATIWTQSEFLMHFLTVCTLLNSDKCNKIYNILSYKDLYSSRCSLLYSLQFILEYLNTLFNNNINIYTKLIKAQQSIPYLLKQIPKLLNNINSDILPSEIELDHIINNLNIKYKCLKLKILAVKHIRIAKKNKQYNILVEKKKK